MTQYGFYYDNSRCTGCHTCEMACKDYHDLPQTASYRKVYDYEGGETTLEDGVVKSSVFMYHVSAACNHCAEPACVPACPFGAVEKDEDGIVFINQDTCLGSQECVEACPYGVPVYFEDIKRSNKCDYCRSRVVNGLAPICVEACPLRALEFGDIEELRAAHPDAVDSIAPLADPSETVPSLLIKQSAAAKDAGDDTGMVTNEKEVTGVPAWDWE